MSTPAPHAKQVKVREKSTGNVFEAWPVDARELVTHSLGEHEYAPDDAPIGVPDKPAPPAPPPPTNQEKLEALSVKVLGEHAKKFNIAARQTKDELVAALLPHLEAGLLNLDVVVLPPAPTAQLPQVEQ